MLCYTGLGVLARHGALDDMVMCEVELAGPFGKLPLLPLEVALQLPHTTRTTLPTLLASTKEAAVHAARAERR